MPRQAASVILLRGGADALELLLVKRTPKARFMGGVWVFPGGAVDAGEGEGDAAHRVAAVRELEEEAAIAVADPGALVKFSRWITPAEVVIRFDTHFFLAPAARRPGADDRRRRDRRPGLVHARAARSTPTSAARSCSSSRPSSTSSSSPPSPAPTPLLDHRARARGRPRRSRASSPRARPRACCCPASRATTTDGPARLGVAAHRAPVEFLAVPAGDGHEEQRQVPPSLEALPPSGVVTPRAGPLGDRAAEPDLAARAEERKNIAALLSPGARARARARACRSRFSCRA